MDATSREASPSARPKSPSTRSTSSSHVCLTTLAARPLPLDSDDDNNSTLRSSPSSRTFDGSAPTTPGLSGSSSAILLGSLGFKSTNNVTPCARETTKTSDDRTKYIAARIRARRKLELDREPRAHSDVAYSMSRKMRRIVAREYGSGPGPDHYLIYSDSDDDCSSGDDSSDHDATDRGRGAAALDGVDEAAPRGRTYTDVDGRVLEEDRINWDEWDRQIEKKAMRDERAALLRRIQEQHSRGVLGWFLWLVGLGYPPPSEEDGYDAAEEKKIEAEMQRMIREQEEERMRRKREYIDSVVANLEEPGDGMVADVAWLVGMILMIPFH
ncbi:uncharacterized protein THITE_2124317 [Thermothielavioides terrestris NRRL 8126]|uniref:Uncharacterized protein n=1 Tax=Thermothielavioides terrestris (strain ATCC 38088 / NRRL 8126) TaxID=578455 RepID=G2RFP3_THETT|nr:uncharacterized protein THITE_2124317 [Thermothielavioides terrestris NRRL 8126]AEO71647.1 hypothetical protein THITE_2124317 [Thermothielavioides terrestris NRRL 8126]